MNTQPFVYRLDYIGLNQDYYYEDVDGSFKGMWYIGKHGRKGCHPSDIGTKYFTSSEWVEQVIKEEGASVFRYIILALVPTNKAALALETEILTILDAANNPCSFNRSNGHVKMTANWQDPDYHRRMCELASAKMKKMWKDPAFREIRSQAAKSQASQEGTPERFLEIIRQNWSNPEYRQMMVEKARMQMQDPEHRKKAAENLKCLWTDPDFRENKIAQVKSLWDDPDFRENQKTLNKARWSNPEYRQMMVEKARMQMQDPEHRKKLAELNSVRMTGSKHHQAKLTEKDIPVIRARALTENNVDIAKDYSVTPTTIGFIVKRKTWRHV